MPWLSLSAVPGNIRTEAPSDYSREVWYFARKSWVHNITAECWQWAHRRCGSENHCSCWEKKDTSPFGEESSALTNFLQEALAAPEPRALLVPAVIVWAFFLLGLLVCCWFCVIIQAGNTSYPAALTVAGPQQPHTSLKPLGYRWGSIFHSTFPRPEILTTCSCKFAWSRVQTKDVDCLT